MTAADHLHPQQFSTWYHGTTRQNAESIANSGLKSQTSPPDKPYHTLASHADEAMYHAGKSGAVVEFHVPDDKAGEYLTSTEPHKSMGMLGKPRLSGIQKELPKEMVHKVITW